MFTVSRCFFTAIETDIKSIKLANLMAKKRKSFWGPVLLVIVVALAGFLYQQGFLDIISPEKEIISENSSPTPANHNSSTIKIANWNLQIFGKSKASNPELMKFYVSTIDDYDIVFIQEIRDSEGESFTSLCSMLPDYDCKISSRAGRSSSKEQYGVIYKEGINIKKFEDYNPDSQDRWERPPIEVTFEINGYELTAYNIHIKPDDVRAELTFLEEIVSTEGNRMVLGDLNADCSYYDPSKKEFDDWKWIIGDEEDTTSSATDCAYDRIILNSDAYQEYVSYGVFREGITKEVSDHYLVWVELRVN